jgi:TetR/AcrR family transcriptional regulator, transcriptional repressor for nem operon
MPKKTKRRRIPQQTRAGLIDAATELFLEQGLDAPSLDLICERAGYTRGAFYVHFSSRDELVGAVVEKSMRELLDAIVGEADTHELPEIVASFVRALGAGLVPIGRRVRISQVLEACGRSWELRVKFLALLVSARQRIAEAVRRSQRSGVVREGVRPEAVADLLLAAVLGVLVALQLDAPYDATAVEAELRAMLAPPPAKKRARSARSS